MEERERATTARQAQRQAELLASQTLRRQQLQAQRELSEAESLTRNMQFCIPSQDPILQEDNSRKKLDVVYEPGKVTFDSFIDKN